MMVPLGSELQVVVSCCMAAENRIKSWFSVRSVISPATHVAIPILNT